MPSSNLSSHCVATVHAMTHSNTDVFLEEKRGEYLCNTKETMKSLRIKGIDVHLCGPALSSCWKFPLILLTESAVTAVLSTVDKALRTQKYYYYNYSAK